MSDERVRVEVAFVSGQAIAVLVELTTADALEGALQTSQDGSYTFEAEDGRYTIPLARVVYVKRFARESRVGFGAGSDS
jgi:hypothetical protein